MPDTRLQSLELDVHMVHPIMTPLSASGLLRHLQAEPALFSFIILDHAGCIVSSLPVGNFSCSAYNRYNVWEDTGWTSLRSMCIPSHGHSCVITSVHYQYSRHT